MAKTDTFIKDFETSLDSSQKLYWY